MLQAAAFAVAAVLVVTAFAVAFMTVAAMLAMTVMAAVGLAAVSQAAGQKGCNCLIGISGDPRIDFNAGEFNPSIRLCIAICKALGVKLDDIFWEDEENEV